MTYNPFMFPDFQGESDPALTDPREELYDTYTNMHESFEDFCDRMVEEHGIMWVPKLAVREAIIGGLCSKK